MEPHDPEPSMRPIGVVQSPFSDSRSAPRQARLAPRVSGAILVEEPYRRGLEDLAGFDYLWIVALLDRPRDPPDDPHRVQPLLRSDGRSVSLFATRCPIRQNPIAFTLSELLHLDLERGVLEVRGMDLADGTPILDLKPYVPAFDRPQGGVPVAAGWYDQDHLSAPLPIEAARAEALEAAQSWIAASKPFVVVQPLQQHGPGVRRGGEFCVATDTDVAGELRGGAIPREEVLALARQVLAPGNGTVMTLAVNTRWAIRHALGTGPEVVAVASPGLEMAAKWWECLRTGIPVALAVALDGAHQTTVFAPGEAVGPLAAIDPVRAAAAQLLHLRHEAGQVVDGTGEPRVALQTFFPIPKLVLAGWRAFGGVIAEFARPMGWRCVTAQGPDEAVAMVRELGPLDGVVVMGHDPDVDEPVLEVALRPGGPGFVGASGSAAVVEDRKQRLAARGVRAEDIARLRSPVGLPIGGTTAPEIALSIVAELQASRYGR